jgi:GMP synthase (glutamine-hydrolysing)
MRSVKDMKKLFIIKAGSTFSQTARKYGDFEDMTRRGTGLQRELVSVVDATGAGQLPAADSCGGVIVTGAHCMVTDNLPWSLAIEAWLQKLVAAEVPLLGICYGHQLLGRAMGGRVDYHPQGKEVGTFEVRLRPAYRDDPLFSGLPRQFPVHTTHSQSVLVLPPGAVLLAENEFEPHHAFRLGRCAWGVQFHPEYDSRIMRDYIIAQADSLAEAGQQPDSLLSAVRETPTAHSILRKFASLSLA